MIKGIIFDMDGTIVDSIPYHYEAWKKFFNEKKVTNFSKKLDSFKDKGGSTLDLMRSIYGNIYSKKELKKIIRSVANYNKNEVYALAKLKIIDLAIKGDENPIKTFVRKHKKNMYFM